MWYDPRTYMLRIGDVLAAWLMCIGMAACGLATEIAAGIKRADVRPYMCGLPLPEWGARLICSACGSRQTEFVVSGYLPPDRT